jgi:outer membrane assembly lipoprotein YfiO
MKKAAFLLVFTVIMFTAGTAYPYWLWTPKSGKWVNPKTTVRVTPKQQFDAAIVLFEKKHYDQSKQEFSKLIKAYPKSVEAAGSQYYLGRIEEATGRFYPAYQAYQKMIDKYPFSDKIQEVVEREYKIAEAFLSGEKKRSMGMGLPLENPAVEILSKVVENSNYGPLADKAQYKIGLVLKGLERYYEAEEAFSKLIKSYPDSEWVDAAKFQIASCRAAVSKGADYDQGATKDAADRFQAFVAVHPEAALAPEAQKNISALNDKQALSDYNSGRFYERQRDLESAKIYYNEVVKNYPQSAWAVKSLERLQILERRRK